MIREDRFVMSHRPYAVDLSSLHITTYPARNDRERTIYDCRTSAVWYRRRRGSTVVCIGVLWDIQCLSPADVYEFLARHDDGRYGGNCHGRWDGERYWGAQQPAVIEAHLALLRPMLASYPTVPVGFDGWWTFETFERKAASW